ncbi:hypothetical protein SAMN05421879_101353 [Ornithinimicrobium cerasi]|uniref:Uncharacterized protein n=1 Tax=Ornithinimicrobium cerasi TaxID=2248773 RepID=A0A285VD91_9MICO|nr:hypothetical protein SAMN05421879_101353 [Ornithinimicrobium cerasi]
MEVLSLLRNLESPPRTQLIRSQPTVFLQLLTHGNVVQRESAIEFREIVKCSRHLEPAWNLTGLYPGPELTSQCAGSNRLQGHVHEVGLHPLKGALICVLRVTQH